MKYILILAIVLFSSRCFCQTTVNLKDSFYLYRIKANNYQDSIEKTPKSDTGRLKMLWIKRRYFYQKQKYWEEKFY